MMPTPLDEAQLNLAHDALTSLYALVPPEQHSVSVNYLMVLQQTIHSLSAELEFRRELENKLSFAMRDQAMAVSHMQSAITEARKNQ